jgi:Tfp pilus assembly protein PilZ
MAEAESFHDTTTGPAPRWRHLEFALYETPSVRGEGHLWNISDTGMFIRTQTLPRPGEEIHIVLDLTPSRMSLKGEVRWTTADRPSVLSGFGVQLCEPPSEYRKLLVELARARHRRSGD